jgi:hypothetical protein
MQVRPIGATNHATKSANAKSSRIARNARLTVARGINLRPPEVTMSTILVTILNEQFQGQAHSRSGSSIPRVRQALSLGGRPDDENRARCVPHDRLRCAAEHEARDARSSVRADHNHVRFPLTRRGEDLVSWFPFAHEMPRRWLTGPLHGSSQKRLPFAFQRRDPLCRWNAAVRLKRQRGIDDIH